MGVIHSAPTTNQLRKKTSAKNFVDHPLKESKGVIHSAPTTNQLRKKTSAKNFVDHLLSLRRKDKSLPFVMATSMLIIITVNTHDVTTGLCLPIFLYKYPII
jgi:hypothetical protein